MEVQGQLKDALIQMQRRDRNVVIAIAAAKCSYQNIDIAAQNVHIKTLILLPRIKCSYQTRCWT